MHREQDDLQLERGDLAGHEGPDGGHVQVQALEEQQREEQARLVTDDEPPHRAPIGVVGLRGGEREDPQVDVRVPVLVVGVRMVGVVLADPPAVPESDQQVPVQVPDDVVAPPAREDLTVARVVADEPELHEQHREHRRGEQLPPGITDHHEGRHGAREQHRRPEDPAQVVTAPAIHQPGASDLTEQFRVRPAGGLAVRGSERCRSR